MKEYLFLVKSRLHAGLVGLTMISVMLGCGQPPSVSEHLEPGHKTSSTQKIEDKNSHYEAEFYKREIPQRFFVIDFENTGGSLFRGHKVTAVGVCIVEKVEDKYQITERYTTLVNPERPITPFVVKLVKITDEMVTRPEVPKIEEIFPILEKMFSKDETVFVAHCVGVDYNMFSYLWMEKYKEPFTCLAVDTRQLARYYLGFKKSGIGSLSAHYGLDPAKHHDPSHDAEVAARILIQSLTRMETKGTSIASFIQQRPQK
ncbi:hypothetical protein KAT51_02495 [bacterium]|nr:hypothetical protein [bacterium]